MIPTKTIKLPYSGYKISVYEYLPYPKLVEVIPLFRENQGKAMLDVLEYIVSDITNDESEVIEKEDFINSLHPQDANVINGYIRDMIGSLKVTPPTQKKQPKDS